MSERVAGVTSNSPTPLEYRSAVRASKVLWPRLLPRLAAIFNRVEALLVISQLALWYLHPLPLLAIGTIAGRVMTAITMLVGFIGLLAGLVVAFGMNLEESKSTSSILGMAAGAACLIFYTIEISAFFWGVRF